jgi:predicted dehydrogenase
MAEIGVGLVGYKFMGRAHSNAYRQVGRFFDVDPAPRMAAICGRDEAGVSEAAQNLGWESYETDYRRLIARDDVGLVDVVTPGNTHREIVLSALEAGKHVLCEKPLANDLAEASEMLTAARNAGTVNMVCFNYRLRCSWRESSSLTGGWVRSGTGGRRICRTSSWNPTSP